MKNTKKTKLTALFLVLITLLSALFIPTSAAETNTSEDVGVEEIMPVTSYYCPVNADNFFDHPEWLGYYSPEYLYYSLQINYEVKPLGDGSHEGVDFLDGGGFRINWGGDKCLLYHPEENSHHGGAYYKLSSGTYGVRRFHLDGSVLVD